MKVDAVVVSKKGVSDEFKEMIYKAIPVNRLVVDSTTKPLGRARENAIGQVETPYFVFVDDDVELPANWFESMWQFRARLEASCRIGWLESWSVPMKPDWYYKWNRTRVPKLVRLTRETAANYGNAVLVLTEAVRDWHAPSDLDFGEMLHILYHVLDKGYAAWRLPVVSYHRIQYSKPDEFWEHTIKGMRSIRQVRPELSFADGVRLCLISWGSAMKAFLRTGDAEVMLNGLKWGWSWLKVFR
jgi:hypothetical protein